jgi:hypothetical protein
MCLVLALAIAGTASAQVTGSIQGRVIYEDQPMPGVSVIVTSPALQGQQATVTNAQGDYKIPFLPAGAYNVRFQLASFATLEYDVKISTNQPRTLDAVMYPEAMQEEIVITGQFENVSTGVQGSQTIEQSTLEKLPVQRTLLQAVGLSAGTSASGPRDAVIISGAQSYENLWTMNGMVMNENIRGRAYDNMYIEDAVLETTTMTSNMSAEYGRFSGGVVNMVTKSGGNQFSGSFRANFDKESWNGETPLTTSQSDTLNTAYEATFGGYIIRDALWFFAAGRTKEESEISNIVTLGQPDAGIPYEETNPEDRYEGKLTWGITPSHRLMGSYLKVDEIETNVSTDTPADLGHIVPSRSMPLEAFSLNYTGVLSDSFFLEGLYSEREFTFEGGSGTDPRFGSTWVRDYRYSLGWNGPTFCSPSEQTPYCTDETRAAENYYAKASWFANAQLADSQRLRMGAVHAAGLLDAGKSAYRGPDLRQLDPVGGRARGVAGQQHLDRLVVRQRHLAHFRSVDRQPRPALRQERRHRRRRHPGRQRLADQPAPIGRVGCQGRRLADRHRRRQPLYHGRQPDRRRRIGGRPERVGRLPLRRPGDHRRHRRVPDQLRRPRRHFRLVLQRIRWTRQRGPAVLARLSGPDPGDERCPQLALRRRVHDRRLAEARQSRRGACRHRPPRVR